MKWYNDMTEQETRSFRKVIVVCTVGVILILIVPMVFHAIFSARANFPFDNFTPSCTKRLLPWSSTAFSMLKFQIGVNEGYKIIML